MCTYSRNLCVRKKPPAIGLFSMPSPPSLYSPASFPYAPAPPSPAPWATGTGAPENQGKREAALSLCRVRRRASRAEEVPEGLALCGRTDRCREEVRITAHARAGALAWKRGSGSLCYLGDSTPSAYVHGARERSFNFARSYPPMCAPYLTSRRAEVSAPSAAVRVFSASSNPLCGHLAFHTPYHTPYPNRFPCRARSTTKISTKERRTFH